VNVFFCSGRTWGGQWDSWYGPSGRTPAYHYNLTLVYNSAAGRALAKTSAPIPSNPEDVLRMRGIASVSCGAQSNTTCAGPDSLCLFNVRQDPCELDNLSDRYPLRVSALQELLERYNSTVVIQSTGTTLGPTEWTKLDTSASDVGSGTCRCIIHNVLKFVYSVGHSEWPF
jgi:hypothetical protein